MKYSIYVIEDTGNPLDGGKKLVDEIEGYAKAHERYQQLLTAGIGAVIQPQRPVVEGRVPQGDFGESRRSAYESDYEGDKGWTTDLLRSE